MAGTTTPFRYTYVSNDELICTLQSKNTSIHVSTDRVLRDGRKLTGIVVWASSHRSPLQPDTQVMLKRTGDTVEVTYMAKLTKE